MDFYHSWLYRQVLNTEWFMWTIVFLLLGINVLSPLLVWYFVNGKHALQTIRKNKKSRQS